MVLAAIVVVLLLVMAVLALMINPPEKWTRKITRGKDEK
jgi:hypothetical protein